jgi:recombination protein RecT
MTNALTVERDHYVAVRQEISDKATSELTKLLPPDKAARFVQTGLRALSKNPELLRGTQKSMVNAFYDAAVLDLEPVLGSVYFVKYGDEVTMQIGYRGLVELAKRGDPAIEDIYGQVVYEGDEFSWQEGDDPHITHRPSLDRMVSDPTKITHAYAIAFRAGGRRPVFTVMTKHDVDGIRARSKAKNSGPWVTDYPAMAMKCPVRQLCVRRLSLSAAIKEALERDDEREYGTLPAPPPSARTSSLRESIKAQAAEVKVIDLPEVVISNEPIETPNGVLLNAAEVAEGARAMYADVAPDPEPKPEKCGALSDPALGEIEVCDLAYDHLKVKGSLRRHRSARSTWPA